jgi:hypothetical protein
MGGRQRDACDPFGLDRVGARAEYRQLRRASSRVESIADPSAAFLDGEETIFTRRAGSLPLLAFAGVSDPREHAHSGAIRCPESRFERSHHESSE